MSTTKMFPILRDRKYRDNCPQRIPFGVVAPHEAQALLNHDQTLTRLAERGGLGPDELMAVLEDRPWRVMDPVEAIQQVKDYLEENPYCISCEKTFQRPVGEILIMLGETFYMCPACTQEMQSRED